ncbi:MAG: cystathionine gamma-synthase [Saprospiraceae bacterium]|nr:cystathionine gamma-synthase [Saprospiraceae bacterium]
MKFNTKVIHAGIEPDPTTGAIMTPIYQTSTYVQAAPGDHKGYEYARTQNPTRNVLEKNLAALENGADGICFGSGLAAMDAILKLLRSGDEVISTNDLYGGSYRLIKKIFEPFGLKSKFIDMTRIEELEKAISPDTRLIWIETPTNPLLSIVDIQAVCDVARAKGIMTCVDNTFASPYLQTPLDLGADLVLHSATKYLGGHSDLVLGAVVAKTQELADKLHFVQNASGGVCGPMDSFLVLRGIKTLHLRVQRACDNARKIAAFLEDHPKVGRVLHPGLKSHPHHELASRQMRDFGAMVSFDLKDDSIEKATTVLSGTHLFSLAESLGGVESLIGHPSSMTHASIPREDRIRNGLTDSLIRLSVGVEDVDDLIADLAAALEKV